MSMDIAKIVTALVLAYLIGSFPSAFVVGKLRKGLDIRKVGSHNMGAMNTFYKVGFWSGMLVLVLDVGKGALVVALARWLGTPVFYQFAAGFLSVIGHNFPLFLKFRGGKGGAACIGVLVFVMPWGVPAYLAIFGILMALTRFPTLSYSIAFLCFPFLAVFVYHSTAFLVFSLIMVLLPFLRYIPRIVEMYRSSGGNWKHVLVRKGLKDRL